MIDWPDAAKQGSLVAAGINGVLLGALLLTRRWWSLAPRRGGVTGDSSGEGATLPGEGGSGVGMRRGVFWGLLAVILLAATVLRIPLARSSLWWDEVWQARNASVGEWRPDKKNPGQLKFRETTFAQALWNYRKPANHPPMAVASKACHEVWKKVTRARPGAFNEFVLRLPGFAASLAGIALIALLLRAWGLPAAGLTAALLLAVHPWHIRYGLDNRGYTFLVPLTLIGLWSLWRACGPRSSAFQSTGGGDESESPCEPHGRDGPTSGRAWWVFGFTQALILWSHLLSVWICLSLCATGIWWIWRRNAGRERWCRLARLVAVQAAGAMLFVQLFLPNLIQALQWGEKNQDGRLLDGPVLLDTLTQVAWGDSQYGVPVLGIWWVLAVLGLGLALKLRVPGVGGVVALGVGAALFLFGVWGTGFYFYPRFVFALVVVPVIGLSILAHCLMVRRSQPAFWQKWSKGGLTAAGVAFEGLAVVGILVFLLGLEMATSRSRSLLRHGFSPLREAAAELREAEARGAQVFGYGFGAEALQYYAPTLPYAREADAPQLLTAALERARAAGQPLFVATGYEDLNRLALPEGFALLDDASRARVVWERHGLEPQFAYRIRRID